MLRSTEFAINEEQSQPRSKGRTKMEIRQSGLENKALLVLHILYALQFLETKQSLQMKTSKFVFPGPFKSSLEFSRIDG